jgi:hypothetical protein
MIHCTLGRTVNQRATSEERHAAHDRRTDVAVELNQPQQ